MKFLALFVISAFAVTAFLASAHAQEGDRCLGNDSTWSIERGVTYDNDRWVCAPEAPGATAGGWVRVASAPTPVPSSTGPALPDDIFRTTSRQEGPVVDHRAIAAGALVSGSFLVLIGVTVRHRSRRRLTMAGMLHVEEVRHA